MPVPAERRSNGSVKTTPPIPAILTLPNELLRAVVDQIEADPDKGINVDRRAYLSQESFRPHPKLPTTLAQDLGNLRLTCKRFSELGAIHQFARVTTRFSQKGFQRLEWIAKQKHLGQHVKKFSYMVPYFYVEGRDRVGDVLPSLEASLGHLDVRVYIDKVNEQKRIVETKQDLKALKAALAAFTKLQHVQILPVQDRQDDMLLTYIHHNINLTQFVELKWAPACLHSTRTIGEAMIASHSPCTRFSSPMLSPQSAMILAEHPPGAESSTLGTLAARLTCLELHFDDNMDLDAKMRDLSPLFKTVFLAARNLEAVHVGFPSHRPLSLSLEEIFHGVCWEKLLAFGIQGWRLNAAEIIALAARHRYTLRGLRLRDVLLNEGSMWKDVLSFLRNDMARLDWVSLRRIGYSRHFDEQWAGAGAEVPDDPPGGYSSDSDNDFDDSDHEMDLEGAMAAEAPEESLDDDMSLGTASSFADINVNDLNNDDHGHFDLDMDDDDDDDTDDERGLQGHSMEFPQWNVVPEDNPETRCPVPWCTLNSSGTREPESPEDLGDNGDFVSNATRKAWERWVVRGRPERCPEHCAR
ncbi:hypothetical protein EJ06DRAFT_472677 [Trichodelitschia bisporula]|uniref:Uncharacterized protein n=1 Tax=Trichodelitschia bisporula TaxID=703511 RepID=A0A6G1I382_9PEZI|nr:hypothetical protein EJ06DRAFT_472677 [Trichodelitschia bisporula]